VIQYSTSTTTRTYLISTEFRYEDYEVRVMQVAMYATLTFLYMALRRLGMGWPDYSIVSSSAAYSYKENLWVPRRPGNPTYEVRNSDLYIGGTNSLLLFSYGV
jgi:hypothetical protein